MKKLRRFLKNENGAAEIVEAAIVYPIVIISIFTLVYIGLFILQTVTVQTYAQKIALLAAREVGRPGYVDLINKQDAVTSGAVELALQDYSKSVTAGENYGGLLLTIPKDSRVVRARAYRFWGKDPLQGTTEYDPKSKLGRMLQELVDKNSFLVGRRQAQVEITCENKFITQTIQVTVTQPLVSSGFMEFFGLKTPELKARALCAATDIDEFVRNTNFVTDTLEMLARKLNIDVDKVKSKLDDAMTKIGLK
ncbi:MAG: hypothetical protein MJ065_09590 [Oscillospiraceae bacterium]|nr:hypothetical protein [Oscillospiraceae bacterium]